MPLLRRSDQPQEATSSLLPSLFQLLAGVHLPELSFFGELRSGKMSAVTSPRKRVWQAKVNCLLGRSMSSTGDIGLASNTIVCGAGHVSPITTQNTPSPKARLNPPLAAVHNAKSANSNAGLQTSLVAFKLQLRVVQLVAELPRVVVSKNRLYTCLCVVGGRMNERPRKQLILPCCCRAEPRGFP